jgi:hypothetical protein
MPMSRRGFLAAAGVGAGLASVAAKSTAALDVSIAGAVKRAGPNTPGKLTKLSDTDVYRDPNYYCEPGPSPLSLGNGKVLMAFRRSREVGHFHPEVELCMLTSEDAGKTWGKDPQVFDFGVITNPNLTLLRDGTVLYATHADWLIDKRTFDQLVTDPRNQGMVLYIDDRTQLDLLRLANGKLRTAGKDLLWSTYSAHAGAYVRHSSDQGRTWGPYFWVSPIEGVPPILPGMPSPGYIRNPAFVLDDGSLVIPIYSSSTGAGETVYLMESPDGGMRWKLRGVIGHPQSGIGFNETVLYQCMSGKLVAFMRTSNADGFLYTASSQDGGRTWSSPRKENLWGHPFTVVRMPSGRAMVAYGYRRPPFGIRARLLDAECERIGDAEELVVRSDGGTRDLGYPLATMLPDGTALVAYYFNSKEDEGKQVYIAASVLAEQ